ncbi:MAG TPA: serine/threonine protein kinase [Pyrinomonadaceae bacterium]
MKICPTCKYCYEDPETKCRRSNHLPLKFQRVGTRTIAGRYRLVRLLDIGGTGAVYEGIHLELNQRRAIKLLRPDFAKADPNGNHRLKREALTASKFNHLNLVRIYDFGVNQVPTAANGEFQAELYLVMELIEGPTLRAYLDKQGHLSLSEAIDLVIQIAKGLSEIHLHHVVHRDLKPANLKLTYDRHGNLIVKILDFGSVKPQFQAEAGGDLELTQHMFIGSPRYAAPEICTTGKFDHRSDIYSLGLIFYEMIEGCSPYRANNFPEWLTQHVSADPRPLHRAPARLRDLIMQMLSKKPEQRPQSANAVVATLETIKKLGGQRRQSEQPDRQSVAPDDDETVVAQKNQSRPKNISTSPIKKHRRFMLPHLSVKPAIGLALSITVSLFLTVRLVWPLVKSQPKSEIASGDETNQDEYVTVTDLNIRTLPNPNSEKVGLAEKGSHVRVLNKQNNWYQIVVIRHGRNKEDPDSEDRGWVNASKLTAVVNGA